MPGVRLEASSSPGNCERLVPAVPSLINSLWTHGIHPPAFNLANNPENRRSARLFFTAMPIALRWPRHRSVQTVMIGTP